ncbi:MAG: hypothetical protein R2812_08025 [Gelidibacter sp.]|nr:hypothetical protein [Gelidibacter sp.]
MKAIKTLWSKNELKVYVLLLCANADGLLAEDEIALIKSKTVEETFSKIYNEFSKDDEATSFDKIEDAIGRHEYAHKELSQFKKEILDVFAADNKIHMKESYLAKVLDNMLY